MTWALCRASRRPQLPGRARAGRHLVSGRRRWRLLPDVRPHHEHERDGERGRRGQVPARERRTDDGARTRFPANGRRTVYVNNEFPAITTPFSVVVRQTDGRADLVVERAMYWNDFEGGHGSVAVTAPSTTWLFAEGTTGVERRLRLPDLPAAGQPGHGRRERDLTFFRDSRRTGHLCAHGRRGGRGPTAGARCSSTSSCSRTA